MVQDTDQVSGAEEAASISGPILVTGPSRSGKSEWAEQLALQRQQPVTYVATAIADPNDAPWQARLQRHRDRRPDQWQTVEASQDLAIALPNIPAEHTILLDSLGTWVANHLEASDGDWQTLDSTLVNTLAAIGDRAIIVAEETGWGVVPAYPLGRQFRDRLGTLTRHIAYHSSQVFLVTAGYAIDIKRYGQPVPPLDTLGQEF